MPPRGPWFSLLCLAGAVAAAGAPTDGTLTPAEVRAALRRAHWAAPEPGTFRRVETTESSRNISVVTKYEWRRPDGSRLFRSELVRRAKAHPEQVSTRVTINDGEGTWSLHERAAVRRVWRTDRRQLEAKVETMKREMMATDAARREELMADYCVFSGERVAEDGRLRLHLTTVYGEKAQAMMKDMAEDMMGEAKKEIPLLLRPVVAAVLLAKGGIEGQLPVRQELVVEEATGQIVRSRRYGKNGRLLREQTPPAWERCADLPAEAYVVPAHLERIEAKSFWQAAKLDAKYEKEDRERRRLQPADPTKAKD